MATRWRLNRAAIINVYQYSDETLQFGGGRLLLRGVNGSGKSTAMNMLLPFLLDADTRRIDAAGEQSAVLKSWMLSGRDEQQPIGYLWLEFERGNGVDASYLVCGCGIKANRSTDRVTTWWFLTDRRPGIDLALVEGRVPLGHEALRTALGNHAVFSHEQRPAYRQAVREKLFGGRELDQHFRLLHVVRNPRVGDRIDTDLPAYLDDALPQLSDAALDDAAQPLEDLDEHRRNVHDLARTADTLDALVTVYRSYAANELRSRAQALLHLSDQVTLGERAERRRRKEAEAAALALHELRAEIADLEAAVKRLNQEIAALKDSPAYQLGRELDDLREHVATLQTAVEKAAQRAVRAADRADKAREEVLSSARAASDDLGLTKSEFSALGAFATALKLPTPPPDVPAIAGHVELGGDVPLPTPVLDVEPARLAVAAMRANGHQRRLDINEVQSAMDRIDLRSEDLSREQRERDRTAAGIITAEARLNEARVQLGHEVGAWRTALRTWLARLDALDPTRALSGVDPSLADIADLLDHRREVTEAWTAAADQLADHHRNAQAILNRRHDAEQLEAGQLAATLLELQQRTYPEPPAGSWQRTERRTRLADCIDFLDGLSEDEQSGLEAAMEASGLLGAEISAEGVLQLETGELVVTPAGQVEHPLSQLLVATVPEEFQPDVDPGMISKILDSISIRHDASTETVVAVDGTFRVGALRGRHYKAVAEHIGVTARRTSIERQRTAVAEQLRLANEQIARTNAEVDALQIQINNAVGLRNDLPPSDQLVATMQQAGLAEQQLDKNRDLHDAAVRLARAAEVAHAEAVTATSRIAFTHQIPMDRVALASLEASVAELIATCGRVSGQLTVLVRSHQTWHDRVNGWRHAAEDHRMATAELVQVNSELEPRAMRLATLEDSIGTDYAEVLASLRVSEEDLKRTNDDLGAASGRRDGAVADAARAESAAALSTTDREAAEARCVASLAPMHRTLAVQGLLEAASPSESRSPPDETVRVLPTVSATSAGVRELAEAILAAVPESDRLTVTADSIRQSVRQRRDQLGAGWDADAHQPDDSLPIAIQVTGPAGRSPLAAARDRVRTQLEQQSSLLTAKQDQALRNLLQGLVAREVAEKMHAARELVGLMNRRLEQVTTAHGIGARLIWKRRAEIDHELGATIELLARPPDLRTVEQDADLARALSARIEQARRLDPERRYRDLIADVLDYRTWHEMFVMIRRPGRPDERLTRRTPLSEGEKKIVSYLPLFAAVAASCDAIAEAEPSAPRFLLLDDAFAKVSEDNHAQLFGLLVELDLDFIATSERLWGTHSTVPQLAITEVIRDAELGVIVLEHSSWNGILRSEPS